MWPRWISRSPERDDGAGRDARIGRAGERAAARHLRRAGWKILHRNFRPRDGSGEIDLVCRDRGANELVFVEVKTRSSTEFGEPAEAITPEKRRRIARAALVWLRMLGHPEITFRFDAVEVLATESGTLECHHIRDAFELPEPYLH